MPYNWVIRKCSIPCTVWRRCHNIVIIRINRPQRSTWDAVQLNYMKMFDTPCSFGGDAVILHFMIIKWNSAVWRRCRNLSKFEERIYDAVLDHTNVEWYNLLHCSVFHSMLHGSNNQTSKEPTSPSLESSQYESWREPWCLGGSRWHVARKIEIKGNNLHIHA